MVAEKKGERPMKDKWWEDRFAQWLATGIYRSAVYLLATVDMLPALDAPENALQGDALRSKFEKISPGPHTETSNP